jgi:protein-disulfide isomerase
MLQVMTDYDGQVRWAYKHLPLESLHSKAPREANATECAADQAKFWEYYDLLMERTTSNDSLPDEELFTIADDLGLDRTKFDDCLENETFNDRVLADSEEATSLGGRGTPFSVIIDGEGNIVDVIEGALPYTSVQQTLDALVK